MNIDLAVVVKEYEQTIKDMSARLANYAMREAGLEAKLKALEEKEKKK